MNTISITGLIRIALPDHTLRYCDGGYFSFGGEDYLSDDPVYGTIGHLEAPREGVGDMVPAVNMMLLVPNETAAINISQPGNQTARVIFTIAEYDVESGEITTSETQFDGQVDQTVFTIGKDKKQFALSVVSLAEKLFAGNIGNTLSSTFHKSVWPNETGHDNATGLSVAVAWGVEKAVSSGGGFNGGARDAIYPIINEYFR